MMTNQWFRYEYTRGKFYDLGVEYSAQGKRVRVAQCDIYRTDGTYAGTWMRSNMPGFLVREIERWVHGDPSYAAIQLRPGYRK
jgi:hypothetical protein